MNNYFCYIHIPFCNSKCKYCNFATFGTQNKIEEYIKNVNDEINKASILKKSNIDKKKVNLKSIYFGGGTPSIIKKDHIKSIIFNLKNNFNFDPNIEISIESNPINITKENLVFWSQLGINRISIGVQTLNEKSLTEIGRINKGSIFDTCNILKEVQQNFSVGLDFIVGLPHVKKGEIKDNIDLLLQKYDFINHISVYMLEDNKFSKKWKEYQIKDEEYEQEYIGIKNLLSNYGFHDYEISNFAKSGKECKHNKAYWNHSEVLAFGLGAHSFIDNNRYKNHDTFQEYYDKGLSSIEKLNNKDIFLENLMFSLRTTGLEKELYKKLNHKKIKNFINDGYLVLENNILKLEDKGVLLIDYILREIL